MGDPATCKRCGWAASAHDAQGPASDHQYQAEWQPFIMFPDQPPDDALPPEGWQTYDARTDGLWLHVPDDIWTVAYKLVATASGIDVAEVRIFPTDPPGTYTTGAGEWSNEPSLVPEGGLPARQLRKYRLTAHKEHGKKILEALRERLGENEFKAQLAQYSVPAELVSRIGRDTRNKPKRDLRLAQVAAVYTNAHDAGLAPTKAVAEEFVLSRSRARDLVKDARRAGMLTDAPGAGIAGGRITDLALEILRQEGDANTYARDQ